MAADTPPGSVTVSLAELLRNALRQLPHHEVSLLATYCFGLSSAELIAHERDSVSNAARRTFDETIKRRLHGEPIAYIVGSKGFWKHEFIVNRDVLIPRPETETLLECVLPFIHQSSVVLDLGTGCGAIAVSIAAESRARVIATDIDYAALAVCRSNATRLQVEVELIQADWYGGVNGVFDLVVSNPPYVADDDARLRGDELRFEPSIALAAPDNGYGALQTVVCGGHAHLKPNGLLAVEHGYEQGEGVRQLFAKSAFNDINTYRDLQSHERVTVGWKS